MSTPHFVAEKVGDQYILVRKDTIVSSIKPELCMGGMAALLLGSFSRGLSRWLLWLIGAGLLSVGLACRGKRCGGSNQGRAKVQQMNRGPSYAHEDEGFAPRQKPQDAVDEALMESFPASDPPARMTPAPKIG